MTTFAVHILQFNQQLQIKTKLPKGVEVLNPFQHSTTFSLCEKFYHQYYADADQRKIILGINPGRFGSGLTGIPFTDPIRLEQRCGIANNFEKKAELSSEFIYRMIEAFGGEQTFYRQFYFSSVSPLGFIKDGKNLNYYDIPALQKAIQSFIFQSLHTQLSWPIDKRISFCLGEGDNFRYLSKLNDEHRLFQKVVPLPHPRFIMQYKRKQLSQYIDLYIKRLGES